MDKKDINKKYASMLGQHLAELRKKHNMSLLDMATLLEFHSEFGGNQQIQTNYANLENGHRLINMRQAKIISEKFDDDIIERCLNGATSDKNQIKEARKLVEYFAKYHDCHIEEQKLTNCKSWPEYFSMRKRYIIFKNDEGKEVAALSYDDFLKGHYPNI